ncbi:MAG: THUMP domain-containing protein [Bacteroidota bacterium]
MRQEYIAKTLYGLEEVLENELIALGFEEVTRLNRACSFVTDKKGLYRANLALRTALKILKPLYTFEAFSEHELYAGVKKHNWHELLPVQKTFAVQSVVNSEFFNHSKYVALKTKDAIVDQIREIKGLRPNVDPETPDTLIHINVSMQKVSIALDSSGEPLYKRGYRSNTGLAPINEVLAAGMIDLSGWDPTTSFYDGMCGSGTLLIEAAIKAARRAPNLNRKTFGFTNWSDFDPALLEEVKNELIAGENHDLPHIKGGDMANSAVYITKENIENAGFEGKIEVERSAFNRFAPDEADKAGTVILNPPYGERLESDDIIGLYKGIGDQLKKNFSGFEAWIISSDLEAIKFIGLRPERKIALYNGALACKFHRFSLYSGTKRIHKFEDPARQQ